MNPKSVLCPQKKGKSNHFSCSVTHTVVRRETMSPTRLRFQLNKSGRLEFQDKYWPIMILMTKYICRIARVIYSNMLQNFPILQFYEGRIFRVVHHIWKEEGPVCSISVYLRLFALFKCLTCQSLLCTIVCSIRDFKVCRRQRTYVLEG